MALTTEHMTHLRSNLASGYKFRIRPFLLLFQKAVLIGLASSKRVGSGFF